MTRLPRETFFATCAPGVEPVLYREAKALRLAKLEQQVGGIRFEGTLHDAWRANLHLRTAIRVLLRLSRFAAANEDALYRGVQAQDWERFLTPSGTLVVSAQAKESDLDHTLFIAQQTKDAIVDQFRTRHGERPNVDKEDPDLLVHVHVFRNRCTLLVDTSGVSLHKRGWRRFQGTAPLSETLAAAIVLLSDWDRRSPFIDPFCGSGTLLVEAAMIALDIPAGSFRQRFAFERFPEHEPRVWQDMRQAASKERSAPRHLVLRGTDIDEAAVAGARENVESAGLSGSVQIAAGDVRDAEFRRGWNGWIVTNPPYGERLGGEAELERLYSRFGELLREKCGGYHLALFAGNPKLAKALQLESPKVTALFNGAIPCELLQTEMPRRGQGERI